MDCASESPPLVHYTISPAYRLHGGCVVPGTRARAALLVERDSMTAARI